MIRQLDDDDPAVRDAAVDRLVAKGEAARGAVADEAAHSDSPEVRARAAGVIARLDRAVADRPTTVTLHKANANPRDLFLALAKQGGTDVTFIPDVLWTPQFGQAVRVSVDFTDVPFWEAVDELCRKSGADVRPEFPGDGLKVVAGRGKGLLAGPRVDAGRLTLIAQGYDRYRAVSYADGNQAGSDQLDLTALLDPKLAIVDGTTVDVSVTEATDDKGGSMLVPAAARPRRGVGRLPFGMRTGQSAGPVVKLPVPLKAAADGATALRTIRGTVAVQVADGVDRVVIDDPAAAAAGRVAHAVGPYSVELERCTVSANRVSYSLKVAVTDGTRTDPGLPGVRVEDADGNPVTGFGGGSRTSPRGNGEAEISADLMTRDPVRGPVRLVLTAATKSKTETFPFEFHDLPLPKP